VKRQVRERLEDERPLFESTRKQRGNGDPVSANKGRVKRRLKYARGLGK
jgi:hypothetical protein